MLIPHAHPQGPGGRDNILNFLFSRPSAKYMGTCAGAYYASGTYWWQGTYYGEFYFTPHLFPTVEVRDSMKYQ